MSDSFTIIQLNPTQYIHINQRKQMTTCFGFNTDKHYMNQMILTQYTKAPNKLMMTTPFLTQIQTPLKSPPSTCKLSNQNRDYKWYRAL